MEKDTGRSTYLNEELVHNCFWNIRYNSSNPSLTDSDYLLECPELMNIRMKEVIILGSGRTKSLCDYHCETWGVNFTYMLAKKLDKLFFTDENSEVEKHQYQELNKLKSLHPTLVFPIIYPKFKDFGLPIEIYPIDKIISYFDTKYFCNSIAYMLAYAIYKGYDKIWLYGMEFGETTFDNIRQLLQEKPGMEYWVGIANGEGVEIIIPEESDICKTFDRKMYGEFRNLLGDKNDK